MTKSLVAAEDFEEGDDSLSFTHKEEVVHIIKNWFTMYRITLEEAVLLDREALESKDK